MNKPIQKYLLLNQIYGKNTENSLSFTLPFKMNTHFMEEKIEIIEHHHLL